MRGLAVLIMIQAHVLDSWTRTDARGTWQFSWAILVAGFAAPLFLFCAGLSVALSISSKVQRHGDAAAAAYVVMRRGWWIFFLAFVFRVQAWILGWSNPRAMLRVDILNVMGPSIVAAGALWILFHFKRTRGQTIAFAAAALAIAFATPAVRASTALAALPDPIEGYLRPLGGTSNFCIFPWAGFVFAGAVPGVLLANIRTRDEESRLNAWFAAGGLATAAAAYGASFLPSALGPSQFWGGSPAFFLIRAGVLTLALPLAYAWEHAVPHGAWSPLQQLGRTSLFVYWIHVEMVYGLISLRIHKSMTHPQAWAAFAVFAVFMLLCSVAKDRVVTAWRAAKQRQPVAGTPTGVLT